MSDKKQQSKGRSISDKVVDALGFGGKSNMFDKKFLLFFHFQNFNHGMFAIIGLAFQDLGKKYLDVDPSDMQMYRSIMMMPWSFKLVYGLLNDNTSVINVSKRSWVILMGAIQFLSLIAIFAFNIQSCLVISILLAFTSLSEAFINVTSQTMMVIQARRDPVNGSQNLMTTMYIYTAIGGALGCVLGGLMTENYHPKYCFFWYSFTGLVTMILGCQLTEDSELDFVDTLQTSNEIQTQIEQPVFMVKNQEQLLENDNFESNKNLNMSQDDDIESLLSNESQDNEEQEILAGQEQQEDQQTDSFTKYFFEALLMKEIFLVILFIIFSSVFRPNFNDFQYYFLLDEIHITKFNFAILQLVGNICAMIGALLYKAWFQDVETRTMVAIGLLFSLISNGLTYIFAMRWNLKYGINDQFFLYSTNVVTQVTFEIFAVLPIMVLFAKVTPKKIEGTMFALLTGTLDFCGGVVQPLIGSLLNNKFVHVTKREMSGFSTLCLFSVVFSVISFLMLPLIPTQKQINSYSDERMQKQLKNQKEREQLSNMASEQIKKLS